MIYNFKLKEDANRSLKGKWVSLCLTLLIFSIITLTFTVVYEMLTVNLSKEILHIEEQMINIPLESDADFEIYNRLFEKYMSATGALLIYALIIIAGNVLFSAFSLTITSIYMLVARSGEYKLKDLKGKIKMIKESILLNLLIGIKLIPWFILFIIPGIVKAFAYSLANYIKIENPEYGYSKCIRESERIMNGYKKSLFLFYLSFIGWYLLVSVGEMLVWTFIPSDNAFMIIGHTLVLLLNLPLSVYVGVASVNFYDAVKAERKQVEDYLSGRIYQSQNKAFSDFDTKTEEPFTSFGEKETESKDKENPFSDF